MNKTCAFSNSCSELTVSSFLIGYFFRTLKFTHGNINRKPHWFFPSFFLSPFFCYENRRLTVDQNEKRSFCWWYCWTLCWYCFWHCHWVLIQFISMFVKAKKNYFNSYSGRSYVQTISRYMARSAVSVAAWMSK